MTNLRQSDDGSGKREPGMVLPFEDLTADKLSDFITDKMGVLLQGAKWKSSGATAIPARAVCPQTGAQDMEVAHFGPHAVLYSYSTIHVSAERQTPYTIGYIDFPDGTRALVHIRANSGSLKCDMPVILNADKHEWWAEPNPQGGAHD